MFGAVWDSSQNQPTWWATLLIGAALASALPTGIIPALVRLILSLLRRDHFIGSWYYYSGGFVDGKPVSIREGRLDVKRGFLSPYIGYSYIPAENKRFRFKSKILRDAGRLVENYQTPDGQVSGTVSYHEPYGKTDRLLGFWVSCIFGDASKLLACGLTVLSKNKIPHEDILKVIKDGYEFYGDVPSMIRVRGTFN
jgi:hypothetical protein